MFKISDIKISRDSKIVKDFWEPIQDFKWVADPLHNFECWYVIGMAGDTRFKLWK